MRVMYTFLKKYYPAFEHKDCCKEKLFSILYSEKSEYDDTRLRERFSDMLRLAENYVAFERFKKNPFEFKNQSLLDFSERGLDIHFDKKYKEIKDILHKTRVKDLNYFLQSYYHEADWNNFYEHRNLSGKRKHGNDDFIREIDTYICCFAAYMTSYYVSMYNYEAVMDYRFEYKFYEPVMKFIEDNNLNFYPLIRAQYLILKIRENENDETLYYRLKETYLNDRDEFSAPDRMRIGTLLTNDALRRFKEGKAEFNAERFEIMKLQLEDETYTKEHSWLSREQYLNYVMTSVQLGDFDWAGKFIEEYTEKLAPDRREHAYLYARGFIQYHKKDYDTALRSLAAIKGGDFNYFILIKTLYTRIYFETSDYEKVLSVVDSFRHYLSSNSAIPEYTKTKYSNYIRILNKLVLLKFNYDEFSAEKLAEEIRGISINELTTNKDWLLEKTMELKQHSM